MLIRSDNYSITQEDNKLIITLPQTDKTAVDSFRPIEDRKEKLTSVELAMILAVVKKMYKK